MVLPALTPNLMDPNWDPTPFDCMMKRKNAKRAEPDLTLLSQSGASGDTLRWTENGLAKGAMPGMEAQMKMMSEMHDKMLAAKTPEERNALMAEHMKIMQSGISMMGDMGPGAMMAKPDDMAARQGMLEQRMDMMQSMMQMMMDRMQSVPAT